MPRRRDLALVLLLALGSVAPALAQQTTVQADRAAIGGAFGSEALRVTGIATVSDRIAIGTTSPDLLQRLLVVGDARIEGTYLQMGAGASTELRWPALGQGLPTIGTRAAGTKIVLRPSLGPTTTDYAIGLDVNTLWASVPTNARYAWYTNTELSAQLTAAGNFRLERGPALLNAGVGADDSEIDIIAHGDTPDRVVWPTGAAVPPTTGTRSPGSRLVLYPGVTTGRADYALGMAGSTLWQSVPTSFEHFRWYGGASEVANLAGTGTMELDKDLVPEQPYHGFLGYINRKWLAVHAAELWVETLVAQDTLATIGGRIITAPTTKLLEPFTSAETAFIAEHNNLNIGDYVYMEADKRVEFIKITGKTAWNKVENASFEQGTTGWGPNDNGIFTRSTAYAIRGGWSGRYDVGTTGTPGFSFAPTYPLTASTAYQLCLSLRRGNGAPFTVDDVRMRVEQFQPMQPADTVEPREDDPAWYRACVTQTTSASPGTILRVELVAPPANTYIDEVSLLDVTVHADLPWAEFATIYGATRDLDGTGANTWDAGTALLNTGTCNNGFIDQYSLRGARSASEFGPTMVGNVRTGCSASADYAAWRPRWAIGNLRGLYEYTSDIYGLAAGNQDAVWFAVENSNGLRMMNGLTTMAQLSPTGTLTLGRTDSAHMVQTPSGIAFRNGTGQNRFTINGITGDLDTIGNITVGTNAYIRSGAASAWNSGTGFFLQGVSGNARALIGNAATNRLQWDGTNLQLQSRNLDIGIGSPAMRIRGTSTVSGGPESSILFDLSGLGGQGFWLGAHRSAGEDSLIIQPTTQTINDTYISLETTRTAAGTTAVTIESSAARPSSIDVFGDVISVGRVTVGIMQPHLQRGMDLGSTTRRWRNLYVGAANIENGYTGNCAGTVVVTAGIVTGCL